MLVLLLGLFEGVFPLLLFLLGFLGVSLLELAVVLETLGHQFLILV